VEQGVTNDLFPNEKRIDDDLLGETLTQIVDCQFRPLPEDTVNFVAGSSNSNEGNLTSEISSAFFNFAFAMRLSAPPPTTALTTAEKTGQTLFAQIGCNQCHANNSTKYGNYFQQQLSGGVKIPCRFLPSLTLPFTPWPVAPV